MFASRANNENAIYEQETTAAGKPLNQGVKGLAPNAFVTPAGPRIRAPLGNKTTNAKATALQTPAPPTQEKPAAQNSSPRMRRAKIKIHEAEAEAAEDEKEEREIEYMHPRGVPLPDHPDDWPIDRTYPQFEGKNLTRGWLSEFAPVQDDDEDDLAYLDAKIKRVAELNAKKKEQQTKKTTVVKPSPMQKANRDPLTAKPAQGLSSKGAASALSTSTKPSFGKAKTPASSALASTKTTTTTIAPGNPRHTAAKVASNSTLGYSKGRAVSATTRKPLSGLLAVGDKAAPSNENNSLFSSGCAKTIDEIFDLDSLMIGDAPTKGDVEVDRDEDEECFQFDTIEV